MTKLDAAIENLYQVFGRNPKPKFVDYCRCGCTKPEISAKLTAVPLRELPFEDLEFYCFSALTKLGSTNDFRYFLPRLFEGAVRYNFLTDPEILFEKLPYGKWWTWPQEEIEAIRWYMRELWTIGLNRFPLYEHLLSFLEIETLLTCIAIPGEPLEPYLDEWTSNQSLPANQHLIEFVTLHGDQFANGGTLTQAFWEEVPEQAGKTLRAWILRPDILQRTQANAHLLQEDGMEHLFEPAVKTLLREADSVVAD